MFVDGPTNGQTDEQRKLCNCLIGRQVGIGRIGKDGYQMSKDMCNVDGSAVEKRRVEGK